MFDLAAFGTYAADAIERNEAAELAAIAEAAERLVDWPSDHVRTAAVYGFLRASRTTASANLNAAHFNGSCGISVPPQSLPAESLMITGALRRQEFDVANTVRPPNKPLRPTGFAGR